MGNSIVIAETGEFRPYTRKGAAACVAAPRVLDFGGLEFGDFLAVYDVDAGGEILAVDHDTLEVVYL